MAIEEEFSIEIPDKEADAIHSGKRNNDAHLRGQRSDENNSRPSSRIHLRSTRRTLVEFSRDGG